ncbi:MAG: aldo/keto reductase [Planctomycetota bacterium]
MQSQLLGATDVAVSRLAYGCMSYLNTWSPAEVDATRVANAHACVEAALDCGITLFDHADIYCQTECERVFGDWLRDHPQHRGGIQIATKCGVVFADQPRPGDPPRYDLSADYIRRSVDASLRRLATDRIDLYQLHRPDLLLDAGEIAGVLRELRDAGKVLHFGLSNFRSETFDLVADACAAEGVRLESHQILLHALDPAHMDDGLLDQCQARKVTPLAYGPVGRGKLGDGVDSGGDEQVHRVQSVLDELADSYDTIRSNIALAFLLKHPAGIVPILGTSKPGRITAAAKAVDVDLSHTDWYRVHLAARGTKLP